MRDLFSVVMLSSWQYPLDGLSKDGIQRASQLHLRDADMISTYIVASDELQSLNRIRCLSCFCQVLLAEADINSRVFKIRSWVMDVGWG